MENIENIKLVCKATGWTEEKAEEEMERAKSNGLSYYRYAHNNGWELTDRQIKHLAKHLNSQAKIRKNTMSIVREYTGWTEEQASEKMNQAKDKGVPFYKYLSNRCWEMSEEEIDNLGKMLSEKEKTDLEDSVEMLAEKTGWDYEKCKKALLSAEKIGIKYSQYISKEVFTLTPKEIMEMGFALREKIRVKHKNNEFYVKVVAQKANISVEQARKDMYEAKRNGVSYLKYAQKAGWTLSEYQMKYLADFLKEDKIRVNNNKKTYIDKICAATGWSRAKAELEVLKSSNKTGASYEDYAAFKFWEIPLKEQKKYATLECINKLNLVYNDHIIGRKYLDDKAQFNETFKDLIKRKWFTNSPDMTYEEFLGHISGLNRVLLKPLAATCGIGITKYSCNESEEQNKELYEIIKNSPPSIVEEFIIQDDIVKQFCETSVNTVRVMTINHNDESKVVYGLFRMGRGGVVDNFHAGGIAAAIDVETGVVCTDGADVNFDIYEIHPYSNLKIQGFQVPKWEIICETAIAASKLVPGVNVIGWDFAVTKDGIDLIEGNSGAYVVAQLLYSTKRIGIRDKIYDPYIEA